MAYTWHIHGISMNDKPVATTPPGRVPRPGAELPLPNVRQTDHPGHRRQVRPRRPESGGLENFKTHPDKFIRINTCVCIYIYILCILYIYIYIVYI